MIKESVSQGTAWQVLETMHWIQENNNEPLLFYDARDKAYKLGLLEKDGKLRVKKGK
jgi:phage-related protein